MELLRHYSFILFDLCEILSHGFSYFIKVQET